MPLSESTSELPKHPTSPEFAVRDEPDRTRERKWFEPRDGRGGLSRRDNPVQAPQAVRGQREGSRGFSMQQTGAGPVSIGLHWGMFRLVPPITSARSFFFGTRIVGPGGSGGSPGVIVLVAPRKLQMPRHCGARAAARTSLRPARH